MTTAQTVPQPLRARIVAFIEQYDRELPITALDTALDQAQRLSDEALKLKPIREPELLLRLNSVGAKLRRLQTERDKRRTQLENIASLPAQAQLEYAGLMDDIKRHRQALENGNLPPAKRERIQFYLSVCLKRLNEVIAAKSEEREERAISEGAMLDKDALRRAQARYRRILEHNPHNERAAKMLDFINSSLERKKEAE